MKKVGSLSNGTLSLKFMQRAGTSKKVEADIKALTDDSEWHAPKEVREALGLQTTISAGGSSQPAITYESSYLPFLFPSFEQSAESPTTITGRRKFKKHGEEVSVTETTASTSAEIPPPESPSQVKEEPSKTPTHAPSPTTPDLPKPKPGIFLRPSGVDAAPEVKVKTEVPNMVMGARANKKGKRVAAESDAVGEKRKKKKVKATGT